MKSNDELKDQSFFLAQIDPKLLSRILFPVGHLHKNEVREIARQVGFEKVSKKSSSVGICFIGKRKFSEFINNYLDKKDGSIVDLETNKTLDHHEGIYHYTIGQRIPITDKLNVKKKRYYVAGKDFENNTIFVVLTSTIIKPIFIVLLRKSSFFKRLMGLIIQRCIIISSLLKNLIGFVRIEILVHIRCSTMSLTLNFNISIFNHHLIV